MDFDVCNALPQQKRDVEDSELSLDFVKMIGIEEKSKIEILPLEKLRPYAKHPFRVQRNEQLQALADDIKANGLIHAIVVRQYDFDGNYEILAGHRRTEAHKLAGLTHIKSEIVNATDDQASRIVTLSNFLQRETILPSERAKSYQLRNEYIKGIKKSCVKNGANPDVIKGLSVPSRVGSGAEIDVTEEIGSILSREFGDSPSNIYRYIRLNYLIDELLEIVDAKKMRVDTAVELSYLSEKYQKMIYKYFYTDQYAKLIPDMLPDIKETAKSKTLNENKLKLIVARGKIANAQKGGLNFKKAFVKKYMGYFDSKQELMRTMERLLDEYVQSKN